MLDNFAFGNTGETFKNMASVLIHLLSNSYFIIQRNFFSCDFESFNKKKLYSMLKHFSVNKTVQNPEY